MCGLHVDDRWSSSTRLNGKLKFCAALNFSNSCVLSGLLPRPSRDVGKIVMCVRWIRFRFRWSYDDDGDEDGEASSEG
jgi:hypothetical protein